jgi:hypothetical protein
MLLPTKTQPFLHAQKTPPRPPPPPKKKVAVFGFCDIRRFTDATEVLREGVMGFVNAIAALVHGAVAARCVAESGGEGCGCF